LNRPPHLHSDGSRKFISAADREREDRVARLVGREWGVELVRLPEMHVLDWYFKGHERLLGFAELKGRQHPRGRFPTVFLSLNKWLALLQAATHGKPSMFVACFTDCVCCRWSASIWAASSSPARATQTRSRASKSRRVDGRRLSPTERARWSAKRSS
jgi:hypothetical protein